MVQPQRPTIERRARPAITGSAGRSRRPYGWQTLWTRQSVIHFVAMTISNSLDPPVRMPDDSAPDLAGLPRREWLRSDLVHVVAARITRTIAQGDALCESEP